MISSYQSYYPVTQLAWMKPGTRLNVFNVANYSEDLLLFFIWKQNKLSPISQRKRLLLLSGQYGDYNGCLTMAIS